MHIRKFTAVAIAAGLIATFGMASDAGAATMAKPAAAPAKPAGCLLKSGARAADGTVIGTFKCEGTAWVKFARPNNLSYMMKTTMAAAKPATK